MSNHGKASMYEAFSGGEIVSLSLSRDPILIGIDQNSFGQYMVSDTVELLLDIKCPGCQSENRISKSGPNPVVRVAAGYGIFGLEHHDCIQCDFPIRWARVFSLLESAGLECKNKKGFGRAMALMVCDILESRKIHHQSLDLLEEDIKSVRFNNWNSLIAFVRFWAASLM